MHSQLRDFSHQFNELKAKESMHKQRLEKKCCDLQKAEAEVSHDCSYNNDSDHAYPSNACFVLYKHITLTCSGVSENCVHTLFTRRRNYCWIKK